MDSNLLNIVEGSIECKLHKIRKDKPMLGFVNVSSHNSCFFWGLRIIVGIPKRSSISIFNSFVLQHYKSIKLNVDNLRSVDGLYDYTKTKSILFLVSCISQINFFRYKAPMETILRAEWYKIGMGLNLGAEGPCIKLCWLLSTGSGLHYHHGKINIRWLEYFAETSHGILTHAIKFCFIWTTCSRK